MEVSNLLASIEGANNAVAWPGFPALLRSEFFRRTTIILKYNPDRYRDFGTSCTTLKQKHMKQQGTLQWVKVSTILPIKSVVMLIYQGY